MRKHITLKSWLHTTVMAVAVAIVAAGSLGMQSVGAIAHNDNTSDKTRFNGNSLLSKPQDAKKSSQKAKTTQSTFVAECPAEIRCIVMPAAYEMNDGDVGNYGNYDKANRPTDMSINSIVIHDTEGDLQSVLDAFQNPTFYASSHYVIDKDGTVYQMVQNKDVAWHAGNWWYNMHSIGIEHVGRAHKGGTDYTPEMYKASAALIKWLTQKYQIANDRQHVIGHDNVPASSAARVAGMHVDPGPFWNWQKYMAYAGAPVFPNMNVSTKFVTIAPLWSQNKQTVTGCWPDAQSCVPTEPQSTNFVYVRTEPRSDAPLIADAVIGAGSTAINNNADRIFHGQTFAIADAKVKQEGIWYKIWLNGGTGWFLSAWNAPTAFPTSGSYVTPKAGRETIPVYGRPTPKQSEYPADFTPPAGAISYPETVTLPYTVKKGERYKVVGGPVKAEHFYAWTIDQSLPYDHTVFKGTDEYYLVQFGNRLYFVNRADVDVK